MMSPRCCFLLPEIRSPTFTAVNLCLRWRDEHPEGDVHDPPIKSCVSIINQLKGVEPSRKYHRTGVLTGVLGGSEARSSLPE